MNELLSSYPTPSISPATLKHLHGLSALIPPEEDTPKYDKIKHELEELIRLVEAVKLVNTDEVSLGGADKPAPASSLNDVYTENSPPPASVEGSGRLLMKHAARTVDGFYVVEADRYR